LKPDIRVILAFAAIYVIWGTTYLAIKIGIESMPPFMMAAIRYLIAGTLLLLYCFFRKEKFDRKSVLQSLLIGAFVMTAGQAVVFWAEKYISSGLAAIFGSLLPICYILTDTRNWEKYRKSKTTLLSIGLGLAGIVILFIHPSVAEKQYHGTITIIASAAAVASCFCWAGGSLYFKYHVKSGSLYGNVGWQLIGGMVTSLLISGLSGEWLNFSFAAVSLHAWLAVVYLAIAGSIVALIALYWLLARRPAPLVGTYAYVNPVIAVILGYFIANEKITWLQVLGMAIILLAAYLANTIKMKGESS
jgi:drug/metabolite transporter (DMT)-like permease